MGVIMINKPVIRFVMFVTIPLFLHAQANYDRPESAVFDATNDRYLISNTGSGDIISVPRLELNNLSIFSTGACASIRGITIVGNTLWGACTANDPPTYSQVLLAFDLNTGAVTDTITITEGAFVNDVTADEAGLLYLSDDNNIYKVDPIAGTYTILLADAGANGLLYEDKNNRLLYTDDSPLVGSQISAIDMNTNGMDVLFINPLDVYWLDGLTKDHLGNYYASAWSLPHRIFRYDPSDASSVVASTGHNRVLHNGAADIYYDQVHYILVVPNMNLNTVDFIQFGQLSADDEWSSIPSEFQLLQNYPNPFNPTTIINYAIPQVTEVRIMVYDMIGREVKTLVNELKVAGYHRVTWNGTNEKGNRVGGGVYLYTIKAGNYLKTQKMVLLK
jgi:hypothetical protein